MELNFKDGVGWITLNAPENGNALNYKVGRAVSEFVARACSEESCRAIVIRSACEDFCRGMDFEAAIDKDRDLRLLSSSFAECLALIARAPKPVIACVEGNAIGGGAGLAAACDIVIAGPASSFSLPEVVVGMIPALIMPYLLRRVTAGRVRYLTMSTRAIGAEEARQYGLVDEVAEDVDRALHAQLKRIFRSAPDAIAETKRYFELLSNGDWLRQEKVSADQLNDWLSRESVMAGVRAFADGFAPPWFENMERERMAEKVHIIRSPGGIFELKIDDAEQQNRLGDQVCEELQAALTELSLDANIRVLIFTGRPEVFCAGATLGILRKLATGKSLEDLGIPLQMLSFPVPILAALEGPAVGGGLALAICCDILIAAENARYGFNFTDMGFTPGMGTTSLLPAMTGHSFAMEMLLTAKYYKGRELRGRGLFSHVVRAEEVRGLAWDLARAMAEKPRPVLEMVKDTLTMPRRIALQEALSRERLMHKLSFSRPDIWSVIQGSYREDNEGERAVL